MEQKGRSLISLLLEETTKCNRGAVKPHLALLSPLPSTGRYRKAVGGAAGLHGDKETDRGEGQPQMRPLPLSLFLSLCLSVLVFPSNHLELFIVEARCSRQARIREDLPSCFAPNGAILHRTGAYCGRKETGGDTKEREG